MWHTGAIYETSAIVSIYTMLFIAVITTVKLMQGAAERPKVRADAVLVGSRAGAAERAVGKITPVE